MLVTSLQIASTALWVPVVGQVAGVLAFAITIGVEAHESGIPMTQKYFEKAVGDADSTTVMGAGSADIMALGLVDKVKAISVVIEKGGFRPIAFLYNGDGGYDAARKRMVKTLEPLVGSSVAEAMVEL